MTQSAKKCGVENCKRSYRAKGYCNVHYKKWRGGELPKSRYKTCAQEGCKKKRHLRGLCEEHYKAAFGKKEEGAAPVAAPVAAPAAPATPAPESPPPAQ
ncbi:MAG: hypothetical protein HYU99_06515 [Deltaproteobacteria bacterium]|nr:hypothetical protein [Deltaproteobacteria bacterium]